MAKKGKKFRPNRESRRNVEIWAAGGMSEVGMASALDISRTTLRKHFAREFAIGAAKREGELLKAMYAAGIAGNVSAQKAFLARRDLAPPASEPKPERPGKKAIAAAEAKKPSEDTAWAELIDPGGRKPN
jgi:hypothetical protein